jgi:hypothetical protein
MIVIVMMREKHLFPYRPFVKFAPIRAIRVIRVHSRPFAFQKKSPVETGLPRMTEHLIKLRVPNNFMRII